jgi:hypothetical protein
MLNAEVKAKPANPAVIRSRPRRDPAQVPFLPSAFCLLHSRRNCSHFARRRAMLLLLDNIQLRDHNIIL